MNQQSIDKSIPQLDMEKYWDDMTDSEKIEKLATSLNNMACELKRLRSYPSHLHAEGKVVLDIDNDNVYVPYYLRNPLNLKNVR